MRRLSLVLPLLVAACAAAEPDAVSAEDDELTARSLFANDVSVLFPRPRGAEVDRLLGATSAGDKGELLPEDVFARLPRLVGEGATREELRVVGVRIDPCFPGLGVEEAAGCWNQLRLVLQPVDARRPEEGVHPKDAAVHAFYTLTREELTDAARAVLAAKRGARGSRRTALGVHPLLEQQGLDGPFAADLRAIVLRHAGARNLSRVTFMTREPSRQGQWKFGGFDLGEASATPMRIASLGEATEQTFSTFLRNGNVTPAIQSPDDLSLLLRSFDADAASPEALANAYTAALRIQNPTLHSPDTVDCVSCHTATSAKLWAEKEKGQSPEGNSAAFSTRFNVALTKSPAAERPDNLHSFGYFFDEVSISQRTANESAAVADYVNQKVLRAR